MAIQHFTCPKCGTEIEDDNADGVHQCPKCGADMQWDCGGGIMPGDYGHTSASLAINPCQTKAHRKLFPGIDVLPVAIMVINLFSHLFVLSSEAFFQIQSSDNIHFVF